MRGSARHADALAFQVFEAFDLGKFWGDDDRLVPAVRIGKKQQTGAFGIDEAGNNEVDLAVGLKRRMRLWPVTGTSSSWTPRSFASSFATSTSRPSGCIC